jgi:hypothetical protein
MARPPIGTTWQWLPIVTALLLTACSSPQTPASSTPSALTAGTEEPSPTSTPSADPGADRLVATVSIGGGPDMPTQAFGSVWVLTLDGPIMGEDLPPSVQRIDPATNEIIATVELPGRLCQGIGASRDALWACGPDGLVRIDPATNTIVAEVKFDAPLGGSRLAWGAQSVWSFATTTVGPDAVVRIDPRTNEVAATITLGHLAGTMAFGFGALWVTSPGDDVLLRIDPATNAVEEWTTGLEAPGQVVVGDEALWVTLYGEHQMEAPDGAPTLARVDPTSGEVTAEVDAGTSLGDASGIAAGDGCVWLRGTDPFLACVDQVTGEIVDQIDGENGTGDVTVAFGSLWATSEHGRVMRLTLEP